MRKSNLLSLAILPALTVTSLADDWTTYRNDNRRSGASDATLKLPLSQKWHHKGGKPQQAWAGPAKWDAYSGNSGLQSLRNFDPCYYVTSTDGKVYYGSSSDNAVHCINLASGKEEWVFFTNSAVRMPPSLKDGKAFFGSDDGFAYCVDSNSGKLVWKTNAAPSKRLIPSNGKLISTHPVRTGVTLVGDKAIFAASLVPWKKSFLWSVDQKTGKPENGGYTQTSNGVTLQGAILNGANLLYIPQGRAACLKYDLPTGKAKGNIGHAGGVFSILTEKNELISAPQNQRAKNDLMKVTNAQGKEIATFNATNRVIVHKGQAYLHTNGKLRQLDHAKYTDLLNQQAVVKEKIKNLNNAIKAFAKLAKPPAAPSAKPTTEEAKKKAATLEKQIADYKKAAEENEKRAPELAKANAELAKINPEIPKCWKWESSLPSPHDMIIAENHLVLGYNDKVEILDKNTGRSIWSATVSGPVHGLAVTGNSLIVSTSTGNIYAFSN